MKKLHLWLNARIDIIGFVFSILLIISIAFQSIISAKNDNLEQEARDIEDRIGSAFREESDVKMACQIVKAKLDVRDVGTDFQNFQNQVYIELFSLEIQYNRLNSGAFDNSVRYTDILNEFKNLDSYYDLDQWKKRNADLFNCENWGYVGNNNDDLDRRSFYLLDMDTNLRARQFYEGFLLVVVLLLSIVSASLQFWKTFFKPRADGKSK